MLKFVAVTAALTFAAACGSHSDAKPAKTVTVTPSVALDDQGQVACQQAGKGAYLAARIAAKLSTVRDLQDAALREEQTGATTLVKAWCAQHGHGG